MHHCVPSTTVQADQILVAKNQTDLACAMKKLNFSPIKSVQLVYVVGKGANRILINQHSSLPNFIY